MIINERVLKLQLIVVIAEYVAILIQEPFENGKATNYDRLMEFRHEEVIINDYIGYLKDIVGYVSLIYLILVNVENHSVK